MKLFVFLLLLFSMTANAEYYCSEWARESSITCISGGDSAYLWRRQCENPCGWRDYGPHCDLEKICTRENPNELQGPCTNWVRIQGTSCYNPSTGNWEQKWSRECTIGLATSWCSDSYPNK